MGIILNGRLVALGATQRDNILVATNTYQARIASNGARVRGYLIQNLSSFSALLNWSNGQPSATDSQRTIYPFETIAGEVEADDLFITTTITNLATAQFLVTTYDHPVAPMGNSPVELYSVLYGTPGFFPDSGTLGRAVFVTKLPSSSVPISMMSAASIYVPGVLPAAHITAADINQTYFSLTAPNGWAVYRELLVIQNIKANNLVAGDVIDLYLYGSLTGNTEELVHFTQITSATAAGLRMARLNNSLIPNTGDRAYPAAALAAGAVRDYFPDTLLARVNGAIAGIGTIDLDLLVMGLY